MAATPEGLLDDRVAAMLAHDPVMLAACYADDARLYIPSAGVDVAGRSQIHDAFAGMFAAGIRPTHFTVLERAVIEDGRHAYAHLSARYDVGAGPEAVSVLVRATEVMERSEDGAWLYVIDHA